MTNCLKLFLGTSVAFRIISQNRGTTTSAFCLAHPKSYPRRSTLFSSLGKPSKNGHEILYSEEVTFALEAVRKACVITKKLQDKLNTITTLQKDDSSPVTVADFASQAVILQHLNEHFQNDLFLAEESSDNLTSHVSKQILNACESSKIKDEITLKSCIDLGKKFYRKNTGSHRVWCLDPIDGTKGFLRGEQYCVALALLEDGIPTIGILACPNLPFTDGSGSSSVGCIFVACKGKGCFQLDLEELSNRPPKRLDSSSAALRDPSTARFCVGVEQGFADPVGKCKEMAEHLHGRLADDGSGEILYAVRMDSQAKYGVVARGDAEFYVRLPKPEHRDWIWDVAPGVLVLEEAGGVVSDANGKPLDFSVGAKLTSNGILGARSRLQHEALLNAYQK